MNAPRSRGRLILVEGIDGAGKTELLRGLGDRLRSRGFIVRRRREPSDPSLGAAAVSLGATDPWASALLFSLDRWRARASVARALEKGEVVLQDRSYYSTLAYQAAALPPGPARAIARLQARVADRPDTVLWLDLPPAVALSRVARRGAPRAALERLRTLRKVRIAYVRLARGRGWVRLDATRPPGEVLDAAEAALHRRLPRPSREPRVRR